MTKKHKIFGTICYLLCPPPPLLFSPSLPPFSWLPKIMNSAARTLAFLHTANRGGASRGSATPQPMGRRARGHMTPRVCARVRSLSVLSAQPRRAQASLKTRHRRERTSAQSSAESIRCYLSLSRSLSFPLSVSRSLSFSSSVSVSLLSRCRASRSAGGADDFFLFLMFFPLGSRAPERRRGETITPRSY